MDELYKSKQQVIEVMAKVDPLEENLGTDDSAILKMS